MQTLSLPQMSPKAPAGSVKQMLTELITDSGPVYERIGKCWSEVEGVLEALNESEAHKPSEGATLVGDLQDAVISALAFLFEGKPQVKREDGSTFTLRYQFGSIEKAYKTARAQRQAAQAEASRGLARRAGRAAHGGVGGDHAGIAAGV